MTANVTVFALAAPLQVADALRSARASPRAFVLELGVAILIGFALALARVDSAVTLSIREDCHRRPSL